MHSEILTFIKTYKYEQIGLKVRHIFVYNVNPKFSLTLSKIPMALMSLGTHTIPVFMLKLSFVMSFTYTLKFFIILYNIDIWGLIYEVFIQRMFGGLTSHQISIILPYNKAKADICILNLHGGNKIVKA